jgi:hypothetical protein
MDENEIRAVAEAMEQLRQGGTLSAEQLAKLGGTTQSTNKALEAYTKKILGVGQAMGGMAKTVAEGEGSFKSLGSSISGLTGVVGKLASTIPLVGGAAKALAEGVGDAAKFVLDQLDIMAKNYQTLGDASAGAADGVDGLLRQFNALGNYSLPAFTKAVKNNTLGLAAFQGTAAQGAEELSKISGSLTTGQTAQKFLKLGMSLDAVGDATTQYLADSARYGITQGQTTGELTKKTQDYIVEVDKIARLTGQTREQQQNEARKSLANAQFRAKLAEMTANGQAKEAEQLRLYVEGLGGAAGDAARALVTGIPLTKEAAAANLFANDAIRQNTQAIQEGKRATESIVDTQDALAAGTKTFGKQIQYAGDAMFGGIGVQAFDTAAIIQKEGKTRQQRLEDVEKAQKKQSEASGELTEDFTKAQLATANSSKNLQSLGFSLSKAAIPAVKLFAETLDKATGYINKKFGLGGTVPSRPSESTSSPGGGAGGATVSGKSVTIGGETRTGGDRNWRNNNPGNIEYGAFAIKYGAIGTDGRFAIFPTEEQGRIAQDALLKSRNYAKLSLADAIKRYAPSNENDPKSYANQIMKSTGIDTSKTYASLTPEEQSKVLDAMKRIEGGRAGTVTGPSSGYQSRVASVDNPSSAGASTTVKGEQVAEEQQASSSTQSLTKQLAELNQTSRELLAVNKKILARQQ